MENKGKEPRMRTNCKEVLEFLARIRKDGNKRKLNKLGEWKRDHPGEYLFTWDDKDLKYILK